MSSMRNAVQRRSHRERAQPLEREKWGLLEKHKDYSLRAKDFNAKKARLRVLRQKAAERNPDEFAFGMMRSRTNAAGQKITDRGNKALSQEVVQLLKTQDAGYLRTMAQKARKERMSLEEGFVLPEKNTRAGDDDEDDEDEDDNVAPVRRIDEIGNAQDEDKDEDDEFDFGFSAPKPKPRRTVFVDSKEEQASFDPKLNRRSSGLEAGASDALKGQGAANDEVDEDDQDEAEDEDQEQQGGKKKFISAREARKALEAEKEDRALRKRRKREQEIRKARLAAARNREQQLMIAERELDLQRAKMSNSVGGVNKNGVKFKVRERKR
ncbi:hypothetical protein L228DRAFT_283218 [Xylona heveae TC161]|uniref:U3 small nucleolar RNA-associated protein 11 n=1 Tax=Xylona heveae (strain CBS 132557 / TC161) TaxID=1328760 RepID=A0A165GCG2_XYLHT|nr:hypothetical protein L228DRAFT_283218 [Xylona heveae TC161]KZF22024.1 hypothetical protein L228DRAFT_283218 [Xylona heveae TC161]